MYNKKKCARIYMMAWVISTNNYVAWDKTYTKEYIL